MVSARQAFEQELIRRFPETGMFALVAKWDDGKTYKRIEVQEMWVGWRMCLEYQKRTAVGKSDG